MNAPLKDCPYTRDAFPLGKGDAGVRQVIWVVIVQPEVFGWIRRGPILWVTGVIPNPLGGCANGDTGINGEKHDRALLFERAPLAPHRTAAPHGYWVKSRFRFWNSGSSISPRA